MSHPAPALNPFPGLRPFNPEEDYLFFGREEQTLELLARLGSHRFVAVVGTSGSGKSSLVRCGLLSELQGGKMRDAGAAWEIAVTHPGGNPLGLLTEALLDAGLYDRAEENARDNLLATLSRSHFGLVEAVRQARLGPDTSFLLVVDQFEEIFRFHEAGQTQQEAANEFVSLLLEAAAQKDVPIYVVLTMRSDFIGECGQFEGLAEAVNRGEFLIPRLTREQYKRVIEGPIKVAGGQMAPRLLQRLLNDLGQQADQLPCLQHALMRTWNVWAARGAEGPLDLDDYQRVGRMSEALSLHADEVFEALAGDRQRQLCAGLFKALTVQESDNRGVRRPQRLATLCQVLDVPAGELVPIIEAYRHQGVTFLMPSPEVALTDRTVIDLAHESLMRVWVRLRRWVEEEAQAAGIYLRLSESATLHGQGKAGLYRDPELGIALAWKEAQRPNAAWAERYQPGFDAAMAFLAASEKASLAEEQAREAARQRELDRARELAEAQRLRLEQQQRSTRKLHQLIAGLAVIAVIAVAACVAALIANQRASSLAAEARQNEERASKNAQQAEQSRQETASALEIVEAQKAKAEAAERGAKAAEEEGRKLLYTTDMRLAPFLWRDDRTTTEQLRTLLAKHIPEKNSAVKKTDLRGFEWYYFEHLLDHSAAVFLGHKVSVVGTAFTSDGGLVTMDQNGQLRRWDLVSQAEEEANRRDLPGGPGAQVRVLSPNGRLAALAEGNVVRVFDAATGKQTFRIDSANQYNRRLSFSRDERWLVVVDDRIRWVNAQGGAVVASFDWKTLRVESLALSGDGLTLAVAGHGNLANQISVFRLDPDARTVTPLARDFGASGTIGSSALSPDGRRVAVGGWLGGWLMVFDTSTGQLIAFHRSAHASHVTAMAFAGEGTKLATAEAEGTIKVWPDAEKLTAKNQAQLTLKGHQGAVTALGFSLDGRRLASASADRTARVWDLENPGVAIRPLLSNNGSMARFSPDGQLIAAGDGSNVRLWDASNGRLVRELSAGDSRGSIHSVAFSPTDSRLLAVGHGGAADISYVALWDIDAGTELARLPGATDLPNFQLDEHKGAVGALVFSPDGKYLVAGFGSKNLYMGRSFSTPLKVWEVATRRMIHRLDGHSNACLSLDFSRDGTLLASGSRDGTIILWSTRTWKALQTLRNPDKETLFAKSQQPGMVESAAFSPDGETLAMASREGNVHLWEVATGKHRQVLKGHSSSVQVVAFSPDGRTLASGSTDQTVRLWNVETGRELMQLDPGGVALGGANSLAFSPDGKHLLAAADSIAYWSAAPLLWDNHDRAAADLRLVLKSNTDFPGRIRLLSENLRLHEALAKLDARDVRVQAALAATRANWHASQQHWAEAVRDLDRLRKLGSGDAATWLRSPGLIRLATALVHRDRFEDATLLLDEEAKRRAQEGSPKATGFGFIYRAEANTVRLTELLPGSPASRSKILPGDILVKINGVELTKQTISNIPRLLAGEAGTKARLTVRHVSSSQTEEIELVKENYRPDDGASRVSVGLKAAVEERRARGSGDPALLELHAMVHFAGLDADYARQATEYSAAIEVLEKQAARAASEPLRRLYRRRADAYLGARQWQKAVEDYARVVTDKTTDQILLANQALANAEALLRLDVLVPSSEKVGPHWRYTTTIPPEKWKQIDFDDSTWEAGPAPFGTADIPEARTAWTTPRIWLRRRFEIDDVKKVQSLLVRIFCDDIAEVFLNGKPVARREGHTERKYIVQELEQQAQRLLVPGTNVLAVQCLNGADPGYVDLGLYAVPNGSLATKKQRLALGLVGDPWTKWAAVLRMQDDQATIDRVIKRQPRLAGVIGDLYLQGEDGEKDWKRAVETYSRGITAAKADAVLLSKRARAYEALKQWEAAASDWVRAAKDNPQGAEWIVAFAQRLAADGQIPATDPVRGRVRAWFEEQLGKEPENTSLAVALADLLLVASDKWTVLTPTEMKAESDAKLELQNDGSVFVPQKPTVQNETYTLTLPSRRKGIRGLRLEVLADPRLPGGGPGWSGNGHFVLNELTVEASPADRPDQAKQISLRNPWADFSQQGWPIQGAVDGNGNTGWAIQPENNKNHTAVFEMAEAVGEGQAIQLRVRLLQQFDASHKLGRFRLSVTADPLASRRLAAQGLTDPWVKLATAYALNGRNEESVLYFDRAFQRADGYEARKTIVERAALFDEVLSALAQRRPADTAIQLALARKLGERGKQLLADRQPAKAQADLEKCRTIYTRLLSAGDRWTVLKPVEMKTDSGAKMEFQKDGSIFVHQLPGRQNDSCSLVFQSGLKGIKGMRLEALADARLPGGGPGWNTVPPPYKGNFVVNEVTLHAALGDHPDQGKRIDLKDPAADFSQEGWHVRGTVDGNASTGWAIYPRANQDHSAVFELAETVGENTSLLTVRLDQGASFGNYLLGRFRVSVTNDAITVQATRAGFELREHELADVYAALGKAYGQQGQEKETAAAFLEALRRAVDRDGKARILAEAESLQGVLEKLAEQAADDAPVQAALAQHFAEKGDQSGAAAAFAKARALLEKKMAREPEDVSLAAELAQLLLDRAEQETTRWTVLKPTSMKSEGGRR